VPKVLASRKMTDARHQLRVHPMSMGILSLGIGQRSSLLVCKRTLSSFLSAPESAMNAEPAYARPCASARASNARGAFVLDHARCR
jgi:hypothetical protein